MSRYDPERDRVRIAGRWLRWGLRWIALPAALGIFVSGNIDARSLLFLGGERLSAVLLLDGQAYFGHLDDSGESGTLVLRDSYYFADAKGGPTGLPVVLVKRGSEAHEPSDGMRLNRDRVLAVERVDVSSPVGKAIAVERQISHVSPPLVTLNRQTIAAPADVNAQRVAAEHSLQRAYTGAVDQLAKLNELVLPITKNEAQAITQKAIGELRTVRRNALGALAAAVGLAPADAEAYVRATDPSLEAQTFANEPGILLAPDLNAVVNRATQLYSQVGDVAAKQLSQPKTASPPPTPTPRP